MLVEADGRRGLHIDRDARVAPGALNQFGGGRSCLVAVDRGPFSIGGQTRRTGAKSGTASRPYRPCKYTPYLPRSRNIFLVNPDLQTTPRVAAGSTQCEGLKPYLGRIAAATRSTSHETMIENQRPYATTGYRVTGLALRPDSSASLRINNSLIDPSAA